MQNKTERNKDNIPDCYKRLKSQTPVTVDDHTKTTFLIVGQYNHTGDKCFQAKKAEVMKCKK
jgi:hypothetical protein